MNIVSAALTLGFGDSEVMMVLFGGGITVCIVAIVTEALRKVAQTRERERSRREIAAYVAEGSMSPEDGAKLIGAGPAGKAAKSD